MEFLKIATNGQWSLHKANEFAGQRDEDYMSYKKSPLEGKLPQDVGTRGAVHGNPGNKRAPRTIGRERMAGKTPNPMSSAAQERNPGIGLN